MDIEKLIEQLNDWNEKYISNLCGDRTIKCEEYCIKDDCLIVKAATALSTLQAENEKLRAEVESLKKEHCAGCSVPVVEAERLRDLNEAPNLRAELEQVKRERDEAVKDIELIVRRINDCNIKLDDGTTVSSLELGRCHVCKHEETGDCDDGGCIFEWRGQKED